MLRNVFRSAALVIVMTAGLLFFARPAQADAIVLTGGGVGTVNGQDLPGFQLTGSNSSFTGILPIGGVLCCFFNVGDVVDLSRQFSLASLPFQPGPQVVNGVPYTAFVGGLLTFTAVPFVAPATLPANGLTTTFIAHGAISGFTDFAHTSQLFSTELTGTGTATVGARSIGGNSFVGDILSFQFEAPAATPEPASLVLLATGVAGIAARRFQRRRRRVFRSRGIRL